MTPCEEKCFPQFFDDFARRKMFSQIFLSKETRTYLTAYNFWYAFIPTMECLLQTPNGNITIICYGNIIICLTICNIIMERILEEPQSCLMSSVTILLNAISSFYNRVRWKRKKRTSVANILLMCSNNVFRVHNFIQRHLSKWVFFTF